MEEMEYQEVTRVNESTSAIEYSMWTLGQLKAMEERKKQDIDEQRED